MREAHETGTTHETGFAHETGEACKNEVGGSGVKPPAVSPSCVKKIPSKIIISLGGKPKITYLYLLLNENNSLLTILIMKADKISSKLIDKGLKVTPQRIAVYDAIVQLNNHPTADNIIEYIRKNHPHIAVATVYKVLDTLVENNLISKVKTDEDIMRYDSIMHSHHHLYCVDSKKIEDYVDCELNDLLEKYFSEKKIPNFRIEDIKLQIIGKYEQDHA